MIKKNTPCKTRLEIILESIVLDEEAGVSINRAIHEIKKIAFLKGINVDEKLLGSIFYYFQNFNNGKVKKS